MINALRHILDVLERPFVVARYALLIIERWNVICTCCGYTPPNQIKHRRSGMQGICNDTWCVVADARRFYVPTWMKFDKESE